MSEERIDSILDDFIDCGKGCENCLASQEFDGIQICYLLCEYRIRLLDAIRELVENM